MKSHIFGVLTCVTFLATSVVYLSVGHADTETENSTSVPIYSKAVGPHQATAIFRKNETKADSLAAVGWEGCPWCKRLKETTIPTLVDQGYEVRYVDLKNWKGPKVTAGPTLFYYLGTKIVRVQQGYKTAAEVKRYLSKPNRDK